jgi:PAS domain S-box-containing protein
MSESDIRKSRGMSAAAGYGLALVSVAVALAATLLLQPNGLVAPLFFLTILISAWFGGVGPGLLAALLSTVCIAYFFLPPVYNLKFEPAHLPQLLVFFISAVLVSSWSAIRKRAETLLRRARDEQEAKVQERTADLKQANEKLRQRADLLDLTHDTIFARDMNDVITYWNRGAEELYGWSRAEAIGKISHELTQTIFPAPLEEINQTLLRTGRWEGELIHAKRDGTKVVVASRWSLQRNESGQPIAILETNNNITERKRAEETLRERASLLDLTHDTILVRDMNDAITYWNRGAAESYGWTSHETIGQVTHSLLHTVFQEPLERINAELLATGRWEGELMHTKRDGTQVVVASRWSLLKDDQGNAHAILETNNDITERKHAEDALRKTQAELAHVGRVTTMGELTSSIAHEVNQPLAAIVTHGNACLRWLSNNPPNVEEAKQSAARIVKDGHRASEVVGRIRAFFKKATPEKVEVNINSLIEDVISIVQGELRSNRVQLRTDFTSDLPPVISDPIQLQQVLVNLIINGIEAMSTIPGRRELVIKSQRYDSGYVLVAVQDSGPGFDEQQTAQLFNAFFTTKPAGLGMGLSISRTTIEAYGGRLWATHNDGAGATFQFTLPTADEDV